MTTNETRFEFGRNWRRFSKLLSDEKRLLSAAESLKKMLKRDTLEGLRFIDVGCGSGLFSLAALRCGAKEVVSFDYDPESVLCALQIKQALAPNGRWAIERGSVLDSQYLARLGKFDIVYSWGVLHHTGAMWLAMDNIVELLADDGVLFIAIYNDQGVVSRAWGAVKWFYNVAPTPLQWLIGHVYFFFSSLRGLLADVVSRRPILARYRGNNSRGMNAYYDAIDWIGGYPFETAKPEEVFRYYRDRGFVLVELMTRQGPGCNEFVFKYIGARDVTT